MPLERHGSRSRSTVAFVALLVVVLLANWALGPSGHVAVTPGKTLPVELVVTGDLDGLTVDDPGGGRLRVTTVRLTTLDNFGLLWNRLTGGHVVNLGGFGTDVGQINRDGEQHIEESKDQAWAAAMRILGRTRPGAQVVAVADGSAAAAAGIRPGDVIVAVDDEPVPDPSRLADLIGGHDPDETVTVSFDGRDPVTLRSLPVVDDRPVLGVVTVNVVDVPNPFEIDTGDVGGPSAGLMFTLSYLDALTVGDLTGGADIAGTGTVNGFGQVGEIGHIDLKVKAAEAAGSSVFFAPESQAPDAARAATTIEVIPVGTVTDAVKALCDRGGRADGLCDRNL